jgi:lysophospholipase L1-like esterase
MKELSKDHDAAYWDLFEVMGGLNSISIWQEQGLASSDKIHFTNKGYRLNATLLFWAFWEDYETHLQSLAP